MVKLNIKLKWKIGIKSLPTVWRCLLLKNSTGGCGGLEGLNAYCMLVVTFNCEYVET